MTTPWLEATRERLTRRTRQDTCRHCGRPILVGLDADMCALIVHVDPHPISPVLEYIHLLAGGHSYDLTHSELHYRDPHYLQRRDNPVHLSHQCREAKQ